jgi:hypothetical protein
MDFYSAISLQQPADSSLKYCIGGVMVSMLGSSAVDRGFELGSKERL